MADGNAARATHAGLARLGALPVHRHHTVTLAIGVGANTVIFTVVENVLLKPLPYPDSDRLIGVWYTAPGINIKDLNIAPSHYFIEREQSKTLEDIGGLHRRCLQRLRSGEPEHVTGLDVTDGTLPSARYQTCPGPPVHPPGRLAGVAQDVVIS